MRPLGLFLIVIALLLSTTAAQAQLPRFHFVGAPTLTHQHDATILMNDRVLARHHLYDRATDSWRELTRLQAFYLEQRRIDFPDRLLFTPVYVLNDSLIGFDSSMASSGTPQTFYIWNVNTDELVHTGQLPRLDSDRYRRYYFLDAANNVVYYTLDTATTTLSLTLIPLGSTTSTSATYTFAADTDIQQILARTEGGYWIIGKNRVLFTPDFTTFQDVTPVDVTIRQADISRDGSTLYLISADDDNKAYHFSTLASATDVWSTTPIPAEFAQSFNSGRVDASGVLWSYEHQVEAARSGREDGFVSYSASDITAAAQLPNRARVSSFAHSKSGWIVANTLIDLMQSTDGGATWTTLQSPLPKHTLQGHVAISREGTPVMTVAGGPVFLVDVQSAQFSPLPGEYHPVEEGIQSPVRTYFMTPDVYEHHVEGSVCKVDDRWYLGDDRGFAAMDRWNTGKARAIWWEDTLYMQGVWGGLYGSGQFKVRRWVPGDTRDTSDPASADVFTSPITLSNGAVFMGGRYESYFITQSGREEDMQSQYVSSSCMSIGAEAVWVRESNDTIYILSREYGTCSELLTAPINDLALLRRSRRVNRPQPHAWLEHGPEGHSFLIKHSTFEDGIDSVSILSPDLMTNVIAPFDGIDEPSVLDLVYDQRNKVYYATTERGLYRSDPVVTSVEEDVQRPTSDDHDRPASDVQRPIMWFTVMGEQVTSPTASGLYIKITYDGSGSYRAEKIVITAP